MGMYWDFPRLLDEGYDANIRPTSRERKMLASAREEMRACLREAFIAEKALKSKNSLLLEAARRQMVDSPGFKTPKFRVQGSFAYSTEITAIQHPPQEVDMDDGMFLPATYFEGQGAKPVISSEAYFAKVEDVLGRLAAKKGWTLVTSKSTCVRIQINNRLHVDLPLYAIKDTEFSQLVEKAIAKASYLTKNILFDETELRDDFYRGISQDEIMLAHREKGWITSDPRKLENWFKNSVTIHGDMVRKISRILKAQRDASETKSPLSSIAIMVGVVNAFENNPSLNQHKLCRALAEVCTHLDSYFTGTVANPAFPGRDDLALCVNWSPTQRSSIRSSMRNLRSELDNAGRATDRHYALRLLGAAFGEYLDQNINFLEATSVTAQSFANATAEQQPEPPVQSYTSG